MDGGGVNGLQLPFSYQNLFHASKSFSSNNHVKNMFHCTEVIRCLKILAYLYTSLNINLMGLVYYLFLPGQTRGFRIKN